jgi:hypothetical protein
MSSDACPRAELRAVRRLEVDERRHSFAAWTQGEHLARHADLGPFEASGVRRHCEHGRRRQGRFDRRRRRRLPLAREQRAQDERSKYQTVSQHGAFHSTQKRSVTHLN